MINKYVLEINRELYKKNILPVYIYIFFFFQNYTYPLLKKNSKNIKKY